MLIRLFVGRERSILALEQAMKVNKQILLLAQKQADVDDPQPKDLYQVGTIATILQLLKLPDGTVKVLVEGTERASVAELTAGDYFAAQVAQLGDTEKYEEREIDVLDRYVVSQIEPIVYGDLCARLTTKSSHRVQRLVTPNSTKIAKCTCWSAPSSRSFIST